MSIRFENVSKSFGERAVLKDVSFEAAKGEILFILGKSGMGKSVTLKLIIGALKAEAGSIWVESMNLSSVLADPEALDLPKLRQTCGMVFQHPALLDSLTNFDNIAFGLRTSQYQERIGRKLSELEISDTVKRYLALVHLPQDILKRYPAEVSYGVQKRISMARTLAPEPRYLLFDEPTTGLDPLSTSEINGLIFELSRKLKVTSIIVSHDMACALAIADRILFLDQGRILLNAAPAEVMDSKIPLVQDFMSETLALLPPDWKRK